MLTPIVKSWPSQWCLHANDLAIQVLGGYGYTREYDVEQHYRDNRLNPIHEGTHGIQALDLLGRKAAMNGGAGLCALESLLRTTVDRARSTGGEAAELAQQLDAALTRLVEVTRQVHAEPDPTTRLANASIHLEATGHIVLAWIWLEQFLATGDGADELPRGKRLAARYFFRYELPGPNRSWPCSPGSTAPPSSWIPMCCDPPGSTSGSGPAAPLEPAAAAETPIEPQDAIRSSIWLIAEVAPSTIPMSSTCCNPSAVS